MSFEYSSCFSLRSPNMRSDSTSEKPMMAFRGVRSSWDMLARNSDLWRLAASRWRFAASSSLKSRTFSIAMTAWLANVFRTSTRSDEKAPTSGVAHADCACDTRLLTDRYHHHATDTSRSPPLPHPLAWVVIAPDVGDVHDSARAQRGRQRPVEVVEATRKLPDQLFTALDR